MPVPPAGHSRPEHVGRWLAWLLRHGGPAEGVGVDGHGWARLADVAAAGARARPPITAADIADAAVGDRQGRFELAGGRIRAAHGHSLPVDAGRPAPPPRLLYHGTTAAAAAAILREGLSPRGRRHVRLSTTVDAARRVAARRPGPHVILAVDAAAAAADGHHLRASASGVWLADHIPARHLRIVDPER